MKVIVITGSTRGIGYSLADSFLALGCAVMVSGRRPEDVERVVAELSDKHASEQVFGQPCDVTEFSQVKALWGAGKAHFGRIDIWINNAGVSRPRAKFWENSAEDLTSVAETNLLGTMFGCKVAIAGMVEQGFGSVYNMEGLGSDGRHVEGLAVYGTTKYALRYLSEALVIETKGTPVKVGTLSPGMVITDLLVGQNKNRSAEEWEQTKRLFNILADRPETVTPWLARQILQNERSGARIQWLTKRRALWRVLAARFRRRVVVE
jgi:NAD(P)-dependent dehydrogenase (short-subunit alcohol dehydrogenase family)